MNWTDTNEWPMWEQEHVNYLSSFRRVEIDRWSFRASLRTSTCRVEANDFDSAVRPGKEASLLYPEVRLGRRLRVLVQEGDTWHAHFFGYINSYEPWADDPSPLRATVTAYDALAALAPMEIALPPSVNPYVYKADDPDHSALVLLMKAAGLWGTVHIDFDAVGEVELEGTWGDDTRTFAEWLSDLTQAAQCIMSAEPYYATSASDPDFTLHWYQRQYDEPPDWQWSATDADLDAGARIEWNGETP